MQDKRDEDYFTIRTKYWELYYLTVLTITTIFPDRTNTFSLTKWVSSPNMGTIPTSYFGEELWKS